MNFKFQDSEIKRLMMILNHAFDSCGARIDRLHLERLSEVIFQVMSARYRIFHTMDHLFSVSSELEGSTAIAALMHDLIYFQVDKRIHPLVQKYLSEFIIDEKTNECVLPDMNTERWVSICAKLFGFQKDQVLNPFNGLNEFLSAVTAARMFSSYLHEWHVVEIIAAIEATIPFRSQSDSSKDPFIIMKGRLTEINQALSAEQSEKQIEQSIQKAIHLANEDISSFYSSDFGEFIAGTWSLILENNPIFRNPLYTVKEYRNALQKVKGFFSSLTPERVIHRFSGFPEVESFNILKAQIAVNLKHALHYLDIKLIEMTILEVLSEQSGGDAPYFLLIGKADHEENVIPIERFFPKITEKINIQMDQMVLKVLKEGRKSKQSFDFNHSPVAAYLYERMTPSDLDLAVQRSKDFHEGKIDGSTFLKTFKLDLLLPIMKGITEISWSRRLI